MEPVKYAFYPSLLDVFLRHKKHNDDETFDALFDKINGVKYVQTEQQLRGVEFENCVTDRIEGKYIPFLWDSYVTKNFQFSASLVDKIAAKLMYAEKKQEYLEAIIPTHLGSIKLYGIADFTFPEMITDLKTTSNYKCNKYVDSTQHPSYSFIKHLNNNPLKAFKYLATDLDKMYLETYIPTQQMFQKLLVTMYEFIHFIEYYKSNITDEKIFGEEKRPINLTATHRIEGQKLVL